MIRPDSSRNSRHATPHSHPWSSANGSRPSTSRVGDPGHSQLGGFRLGPHYSGDDREVAGFAEPVEHQGKVRALGDVQDLKPRIGHGRQGPALWHRFDPLANARQFASGARSWTRSARTPCVIPRVGPQADNLPCLPERILDLSAGRACYRTSTNRTASTAGPALPRVRLRNPKRVPAEVECTRKLTRRHSRWARTSISNTRTRSRSQRTAKRLRGGGPFGSPQSRNDKR